MEHSAAKPDNPGQGGGPHKFEIFIDGTRFEVEQTSMTGLQLKALAGIDPSYQMFLEQHGRDDDKLIGDNEAVAIKSGLHFFAIPATTFGVVQ